MISKLPATLHKTDQKMFVVCGLVVRVDRLYRSKCFLLYNNYITVVGTSR